MLHVCALKGKVDAVILTIRKDEDRAVAALLGELAPTTGGRSYRLARLTTAGGSAQTVALLRITEPGNSPAQDAARDAIAELDPRLILVVGIAGGVPAPEFTLGDVMLATRVADMRVQALIPDHLPELEVRGERISKKLVDRLNNLIDPVGNWTDAVPPLRPLVPLDRQRFQGSDAWNEKLEKSLRGHFHGTAPRTLPTYFSATVGSSDFLVRDPEALAHWRKAARKIEFIDMEAAGVLEAAHRLEATYPVLIVRGISDIVGYEREPEWTAYACQSAAAFAVGLLRSGQLHDIHP